MDKEEKKRTLTQNRALHKYFSLLADELNELGAEERKHLIEKIDLWWTPEMVKNNLFKVVMRWKLGKESTTELTTKEVDIVFENLQHHLAEKVGIELTFPSIEELINQKREQMILLGLGMLSSM